MKRCNFLNTRHSHPTAENIIDQRAALSQARTRVQVRISVSVGKPTSIRSLGRTPVLTVLTHACFDLWHHHRQGNGSVEVWRDIGPPTLTAQTRWDKCAPTYGDGIHEKDHLYVTTRLVCVSGTHTERIYEAVLLVIYRLCSALFTVHNCRLLALFSAAGAEPLTAL